MGSLVTIGFMKVCLVNDTSDDPNWGAIATSQALRELIHEAGGIVSSTLYQYRIGVAQRDDVADAPTGDTTSDVPDLAPSRWEDFDECAVSVMDGALFPSIHQALSDSDVVLINGEGCIYDRTRQSRMIYFIAYLAKRYFGKPTAIVNHSIVMNDPKLLTIAQHVYPLLDDIVFREPDSALVCPGGNGRVAADAAYRLKPRPVACWEPTLRDAIDPTRPFVALGGGSVFFRGLQPDHDPVPGYMRLSERLLDTVGQVVLTASSHKDRRIMAPLSRELGLPLIDTDVPVQQAVDLLGHACAYVGGRWHPSIFAHGGGAPVIALTRYTPKMEAFLKQADMPLSRFDPFRLDEQCEDIVAAVMTSLGGGEARRERLRAGAERLAELASENVRVLN